MHFIVFCFACDLAHTHNPAAGLWKNCLAWNQSVVETTVLIYSSELFSEDFN